VDSVNCFTLKMVARGLLNRVRKWWQTVLYTIGNKQSCSACCDPWTLPIIFLASTMCSFPSSFDN
jgi:hypothetical protein